MAGTPTFGPHHPAWERAVALHREGAHLPRVRAAVVAAGYPVSYAAVRTAMRRYDAAARRERQRRLRALVPDRDELARLALDPAALARKLAEVGDVDPVLRPTMGEWGWVSRPQLRLQRLLEDAGYAVWPEHPLGHYVVDCYLPERGIAFECDGVRWHSGRVAKAHDRQRDEILLRKHGVVTVRITDEEIATWPA